MFDCKIFILYLLFSVRSDYLRYFPSDFKVSVLFDHIFIFFLLLISLILVFKAVAPILIFNFLKKTGDHLFKFAKQMSHLLFSLLLFFFEILISFKVSYFCDHFVKHFHNQIVVILRFSVFKVYF